MIERMSRIDTPSSNKFLQYAGNHPERQFRRNQVFDQLRKLGGKLVQKLLCLITAEQLGSTLPQHLI